MFGSGRRGWRVDERSGFGFGLYPILWEQGECWTCVSVFWLRWCMGGVGRGLDQGLERWGGVMSVLRC